MTIHHDKLAYGKLASGREDISEEKLAEMLKALNEDSNGGDSDKPDEASGVKAEKKFGACGKSD